MNEDKTRLEKSKMRRDVRRMRIADAMNPDREAKRKTLGETQNRQVEALLHGESTGGWVARTKQTTCHHQQTKGRCVSVLERDQANGRWGCWEKERKTKREKRIYDVDKWETRTRMLGEKRRLLGEPRAVARKRLSPWAAVHHFTLPSSPGEETCARRGDQRC